MAQSVPLSGSPEGITFLKVLSIMMLQAYAYLGDDKRAAKALRSPLRAKRASEPDAATLEDNGQARGSAAGEAPASSMHGPDAALVTVS